LPLSGRKLPLKQNLNLWRGTADLFSEAERQAKEWDYVQWAEALRARPVGLVLNCVDLGQDPAGTARRG